MILYKAFVAKWTYQWLLKQHNIKQTRFKNEITKQTKVDDLVLSDSLSLKECLDLHEIVTMYAQWLDNLFVFFFD
jgi:hypothetical protein